MSRPLNHIVQIAIAWIIVTIIIQLIALAIVFILDIVIIVVVVCHGVFDVDLSCFVDEFELELLIFVFFAVLVGFYGFGEWVGSRDGGDSYREGGLEIFIGIWDWSDSQTRQSNRWMTVVLNLNLSVMLPLLIQRRLWESWQSSWSHSLLPSAYKNPFLPHFTFPLYQTTSAIFKNLGTSKTSYYATHKSTKSFSLHNTCGHKMSDEDEEEWMSWINWDECSDDWELAAMRPNPTHMGLM
jgi:hypothetical protein